jgi:hypothetical protein
LTAASLIAKRRVLLTTPLLRTATAVVPLVCAAVFTAALWINWHMIVRAVYWNADVSTAPVIGETLSHARGDTQILHFGFYTTLAWEVATRHVPFHRELWVATPYLFVVASALLLAWASWRLAGVWAGAVSGALALCSSSRVTYVLFTPDVHTSTCFTSVLLGAFLVFLTRDAGRPFRRTAAVAVAVGLLAGANAASDPLLYYTGLGAFAATIALSACVRRCVGDRATSAAALLLLSAVVGALVTTAVAHDWRIAIYHDPMGVAPWSAMWPNVVKLAEECAELLNGAFWLHGDLGGWLLALVCLVSVCVVAALAVVAAFRGLLRARAGSRSSLPADAVYPVYWVLVLALLFCSYAGSTVGRLSGSYQYFTVTAYALAALAPVVVPRLPGVVTLVTAASVAYCAASFISTNIHWNRFASLPPLAAEVPRLEAIAQDNRVAVGYADFWNSTPVTWATAFRLPIYPIDDCEPTAPLCMHYVQTNTNWYVPRPGRRSMLLSSSGGSYFSGPPGSVLGRWVRRIRLDEQTTVYVYPYDIASRLGRWRVVS